MKTTLYTFLSIGKSTLFVSLLVLERVLRYKWRPLHIHLFEYWKEYSFLSHYWYQKEYWDINEDHSISTIGMGWYDLVWVVWNCILITITMGGMGWYGLVWVGMGWYGLLLVGMGCYGLVWVGMSWYELVWVVWNCILITIILTTIHTITSTSPSPSPSPSSSP